MSPSGRQPFDPGPPLHGAIGPPRSFPGYGGIQASIFAAAWLPAWTGNDPMRLASFYTEDTFYSDPQIPDGIQGRSKLLNYLTRLLKRNPDWVWKQTASRPMRDGFINYWRATVPTRAGTVAVSGVCLLVLREGLIARNEAFFDRTILLGDLPNDEWPS
jgi:hypothetical protein